MFQYPPNKGRSLNILMAGIPLFILSRFESSVVILEKDFSVLQGMKKMTAGSLNAFDNLSPSTNKKMICHHSKDHKQSRRTFKIISKEQIKDKKTLIHAARYKIKPMLQRSE